MQYRFLKHPLGLTWIALKSICVLCADLLAGGHASGVTMVWAEGRAGWQPLQDVPELWAEISAAAVEAVTAAAGSSAGGSIAAQRTAAPVAAAASRPAAAVKAAKAVKADIKPVDRELAAFQAEMAALGATAAAAADEDASLPDLAPGRAETPPPDERRFEDDDGTIFVWDGLLRRFVEEVFILDCHRRACLQADQRVACRLLCCPCP